MAYDLRAELKHEKAKTGFQRSIRHRRISHISSEIIRGTSIECGEGFGPDGGGMFRVGSSAQTRVTH